MGSHNIQYHDELREFPYIFVFLNNRKNFVGTRKRVRISFRLLSFKNISVLDSYSIHRYIIIK